MNKNMKKLITLNVFIYLGLLFFPPALFQIYKSIKLASGPPTVRENLNIHPAFPTDRDKLHGEAMKEDEKNFKTELIFRSFIGWRRSPYTSKYSNVSGPYSNRHSLNSSPDDSTWFFGGSTMWGTGASDLETIPSWYAKSKNTSVYNLGESAWTSRQSLNQLINLLGDGRKPKRIVFYDGVNDIIHGCRTELKEVPSHSQEPLIRKRLQSFPSILMSQIHHHFEQLFQFIAAPYKAIGGKLGLYTAKHVPYGSLDCSLNSDKAKRVADHLVNNWYAAYLLALAHDSGFMAVLQPHSFATKGVNLTYLNKAEYYLKKEHDKVYPLIVEAVKVKCDTDPGFCQNFVDGSSWLDNKKPVYLDFAHITGKGNKIISDKIIVNEAD